MIMTSELNHKDTIQYFEEKGYFGAKKEQVIFFMQSMIPMISSVDGKILLEEPHRISMGPNGNGALFDALNRTPELKQILSTVDYVQVIGVDNPLNRLLDPLYIGFASCNHLQAAMKSVPKRDAKEPVGVVVKKVYGTHQKYDIVEYSEITEEQANRMNPVTGELTFNLGNILVFIMKAELLLQLC